MDDYEEFMKSFDEIQEKVYETISKYDNHNLRLMTLIMLRQFSEINIETAYNNLKEQIGEECADNLLSECNKGISTFGMKESKIEK